MALELLRRVTAERGAVAGLLLSAIAIHIPTLDMPIIEWHGWRQTGTAYPALLFHEQGIDLLHSKLPLFGPPYEAPAEFPLFQLLAALLMNAGVPPDIAVRVTCLATFVVAAFLLWGLVRCAAGPIAGLSALSFFLFMPQNLLWSRTSMIEYLAIAGAVGFLWAGIAWRDRPRWSTYAVALVAGIVGLVVKPPTPIFWVIPLILWRAPNERPGLLGWIRTRLDPALIVLCVTPTLAGFAWTAYIDAIKAPQEAAAFLTSAGGRTYYYSSIAERLDPVIWKRTWSWISGYIFGVGFIPVVFLGLYAAARSRRPAFWLGVCLAALMPVAVFYGGYYRHDYYWTAVTPEVAAIVGLGIAWLWALARTVLVRALVVAALLGMSWLTLTSSYGYWSKMYPPLDDFEGVLPRARELASLSTPNDLIAVIGRSYDPDLAYYARRPVMMLAYENETAHLVSRLASEGYRIVSSWDPTGDEISILRSWRWSGVIGSHTYAVGDSPSDLRRAGIVATDDLAAFAAISNGPALLAQPLHVPCDLASHPIPAGARGTWLRLQQPDPSARITFNALFAPLPSRGVIAFSPDAVFGGTTAQLMCGGAQEIVIEAAYDAPLPP